MCRDLGLAICAFQPFRDFEGMPEPQRARNFARAERKFDLMEELQTDLMLICSNISPASLGGIDRAAADFRELGERAAARGLRVGYEALAWGRHVNDYRDAWEIVRRADHKSIGVILDSFHALAPSFPITAIESIPADKIFLVQLADAPKLGLDVLSWSRHFRCFPGQGDLPVAQFMEAVLATGYVGPAVAGDLQRPVSRRLRGPHRDRRLPLAHAARGSARGPRIARGAARLQPKARSRGVGFIEFAVSEDKGQGSRRAVRAAWLSQDRRPSQQGCRALVARPYRTRDQLRAGRLCAFALCRARSGRLRHRDRRRRCRQDHGARGSA